MHKPEHVLENEAHKISTLSDANKSPNPGQKIKSTFN